MPVSNDKISTLGQVWCFQTFESMAQKVDVPKPAISVRKLQERMVNMLRAGVIGDALGKTVEGCQQPNQAQIRNALALKSGGMTTEMQWSGTSVTDDGELGVKDIRL